MVLLSHYMYFRKVEAGQPATKGKQVINGRRFPVRKVEMARSGVAALETHYYDADWNDWLP
jgi:hypothetical protein